MDELQQYLGAETFGGVARAFSDAAGGQVWNALRSSYARVAGEPLQETS